MGTTIRPCGELRAHADRARGRQAAPSRVGLIVAISTLALSGLPSRAPQATQPHGVVQRQSARPSDLDATSIRFDRIGSEHGLAHNSVTAILQDRAGFLWFGTRDGLSRYDGYEFRTYRQPLAGTASAEANYILSLAETTDGRIWVGTIAGLYTMDSRRSGLEPVALDLETGPAASRIRALHTDGDVVWIGNDEGLLVASGRTGSVQAVDLGDGPYFVSSVRSGPDGAIWALIRDAERRPWLTRLGEPSVRYELGLGPLDFWLADTTTAWVDPQGPLPLAELDEHVWVEDPESEADNSRGPGATAIAVDSAGTTWIGTFRGVFVSDGRGPPRRARSSPALEHTLADEATSILVDRLGAVWIGTYDGILRYDPRRKPFVHLAHRAGDPASLASNHVSAMTQDTEGRLWVGTYGAGIDEIDLTSGRISHHRRDPGSANSLCDDYVWALATSRQTRLWVGTNAGLCELDQSGRFHLRNDETGVAAVAEGNDGMVWLGTSTGLKSWRPGDDSLVTVAPLASWLDTLHIDRQGVIWGGSGGVGSLARYDPKTGSARVYESGVEGGVIDIYDTRAGRLLLATGTGLARFVPDHPSNGGGPSDRLTWLWRGDAEAGSVVYSVRDDAAGRLWLGTSKGLVRWELEDSGGASIRRYDLGDNVGNLEFNRHAAYRGADGTLYFGGMNGLTYFDPASIVDDRTPPTIALTAVRTLSDAGESAVNAVGLERLVLRPDDHAVTFEFVALDFRLPPRSRYAYRLDGFETDWIDNGEMRTVRYTNLPPGDYVFRVRGANADGFWNDAGIALPVTVLPPWWQTWPFRIAAFLATVGVLTIAYQVRMARLRAMDRVRLRIAGDLHDDLGSDLSGIAMLSGVVGTRDYLKPGERTHLAEIETTAIRVMEGLRDIVWYITPEHDNLAAMARRMRAVAERLLPNAERRFRFDVPEQASIDMNRRRDLFLMYKELIHNTARHASASRVDVALDADAATLTLLVEDDGGGFDPDERSDGSGLRSIRARAERLGAELEIRSVPGGGTSTRIRMELARTRHGGAIRRPVA